MENKNKLFLAILLNLVIVFLQIGFGIYAKSISLITDAVHNFQDVISLIIAFIAIIYSAKKPSELRTFGYLRSEVMAGFVNSAVLVGAVFLIMINSIERLFYPEEIEGLYIIIVGFLAFIINAFSAFLLSFHHHHHQHNHHHHDDLNIKAAYLHLLSDAGMSLGVVVGGIFIYLYKIYWIDPLISIFFSIYILKETFPILKKSYSILMEFTPSNINVKKIKNQINKIKGVKDIHDVHIWALSSKDIYFSCHLTLEENISVEEFDNILEKIKESLKKFGINHITIQPETEMYQCENVY